MCSNAARVFVHQSLLSEFTSRLVERTKKMVIGDPYEEGTTVGAMITKEHMDKVLGYIDIAKKEVGVSK